jgi:hypothetical protein
MGGWEGSMLSISDVFMYFMGLKCLANEIYENCENHQAYIFCILLNYKCGGWI